MSAQPGSVRIDDLAEPRLPDDIVAMRESVRDLAASVPFDLPTLEAQAKADTGLDDFGDDLHREPYTVCLRALDTEGGLGPLGRLNAHGNFLQFLRNRLLVVDYLKRTGYKVSDEGGKNLRLDNGHSTLLLTGHSGRAGMQWEPRFGEEERLRIEANRVERALKGTPPPFDETDTFLRSWEQ